MAQATVAAPRSRLVSRLDWKSALFLLGGVALVALAIRLGLDALGFFGRLPAAVITDQKILLFILGAFLAFVAAYLGLWSYRLLRMTDPDWRKEFLRLNAPKAREFRHTAHLVRKSPLTVVGIAMIAFFVGLSAFAWVAPAVVAPYPQDGGAVYYRGELFQPPFARTQVWRIETYGTTDQVTGWLAWTNDEKHVKLSPLDPCPCPRALGGDPLGPTRDAERTDSSANVARSNETGDSFRIRGFRLDDVYTSDIGFVGMRVRQRVDPGNRIAAYVSWDAGLTWSVPRVTSDQNFTSARPGEVLDFTNVTQWTKDKLHPTKFRVWMAHVTDAGASEGPVEIDYLSVLVFFQGKYVTLGTDELGRDYLSRIVLAAPLDLLIALMVVLSALAIGVILGVVSGYYGGWVDELIMRITDVFLSIPGLILALAFTAALGAGLLNIMAALVIVWWPAYTRLIRGQALSIRENLYVEAARAVGATSRRIVVRHILPNAFAPVLVNATLDMGTVILVASALSFLGLGVQPPTPEWGAMVSDGRSHIIAKGEWWLSTFPGLAILFTSMGFNLAGDGLRDILDPRLRR